MMNTIATIAVRSLTARLRVADRAAGELVSTRGAFWRAEWARE
ncbi:MAG TPA: hypothetical protein VGM50_18420 [Gemmatimonadaceae bacterium]|jgi:hypothetical protein